MVRRRAQATTRPLTQPIAVGRPCAYGNPHGSVRTPLRGEGPATHCTAARRFHKMRAPPGAPRGKWRCFMSGERVLVIDDSPTIVRVVQLVLTKAGFDVVAAPDGEVGLAMARAQVPDLILLDFVMP